MCLVVLVSWKLNENETGFSEYLDSQSMVLVVRSGEPILGASGWTPLGSILGGESSELAVIWGHASSNF